MSRSIKRRIVFGLLVTTSVVGCSAGFQRRIGSAGVHCSTSRIQPGFDIAASAGLAYLAYDINREDGESGLGMYIPAAVFAASAIWGIHARSECIRYRKEAPPEAWQRDRPQLSHAQSTMVDVGGAVGAAVISAAVASEIEHQATVSAPTPTSRAAPTPSWSRQTDRTTIRRTTGGKTLTVNGKTYTDGPGGELGRPCGLGNNTCTSPKYACAMITSSSGVCVSD